MNPRTFEGEKPEFTASRKKEAVDLLDDERGDAGLVLCRELVDTLILADTDVDTLADCHGGTKEREWLLQAPDSGNAGANGFETPTG